MLAGKYVTPTLRLARPLGQGAMGCVWVADHLGLETQVAVKFVMPAYAQDRGFVERFRREALAAAKIKGANIAQVYDHGVTAEGQPFIIMELLEGEDLRKRITREGPLDCKTVAAIVHQIAKALTRAHQLGIVHRDIKPDNLFLTESDGELLVKVLDFGVAKVGMDEVTMTASGAMMGTPLYMSPEQFLSTKNVDFRADLWSLGAVVYHALTGGPPFPGETLGAVSVAVHTAPIPKASAVRPDLSPEIDTWFTKAFCRDLADRFPSAKRMAEELDLAVRTCSPRLSSTASAPSGGTVLLETMARGPVSSLSGAVHSASAAPANTGAITGAQARDRAFWRPALTVTGVIVGLAVLGAGSWFGYARQAASTLPVGQSAAIHEVERDLGPKSTTQEAMADDSPTARATDPTPAVAPTGASDSPPSVAPLALPIVEKDPSSRSGRHVATKSDPAASPPRSTPARDSLPPAAPPPAPPPPASTPPGTSAVVTPPAAPPPHVEPPAPIVTPPATPVRPKDTVGF